MVIFHCQPCLVFGGGKGAHMVIFENSLTFYKVGRLGFLGVQVPCAMYPTYPSRRDHVCEPLGHQKLTPRKNFGKIHSLHSLKRTWPLKMDGWNTSFLLGWPIFRVYVSFRECKTNRKSPLKIGRVHPTKRQGKRYLFCCCHPIF